MKPSEHANLALVAFGAALASALVLPGALAETYTNFESSHVHPIGLTPSGTRLLAVNTPDAVLEVFDVGPGGSLSHAGAVPVGLEPVTVVARSDQEAWVVNHLSDAISIVDLGQLATTRTLPTGDEPTDVVFAAGKAFVAVSQVMPSTCSTWRTSTPRRRGSTCSAWTLARWRSTATAAACSPWFSTRATRRR